MGLLTEDEEEVDEVVGWLTADEVFGRIQAHWGENKMKETNANSRPDIRRFADWGSIRSPLTWPTSAAERAIAQLRETIKDQKQEIEYLRKQIEALIEIIKDRQSDG